MSSENAIGPLRGRPGLSNARLALAVVPGVRGEAERSARLFGAAERLLRAFEAPVYDNCERTTAAVRSRFGEAA